MTPSRRILVVGLSVAAVGCVAVLAIIAPGCSSTTPPATVPAAAPGIYSDVTAASGVDVVYQNGEAAGRYAILESLGGGVAVLDFDGDGKRDLFFPGGGGYDPTDKTKITGLAPKLYRNLGGFKFQDVTKEAGLDKLADGQPWFYSHGVAVADYDRDGFPDLLMTGYGRVALWHNDPAPGGGRMFRDVTKEAGLLTGKHFWSSSAAFGDIDGDGYTDLYLCQYVNWSNENDPECPGYFAGIPRDVCPPKKYGALPHALYLNNGKGGFVDVTAAAGLRADRPDKEYGKGLGVVFVDVNLDGKPDIYVANDTVENFLYLNVSEPGKPRFEDRGSQLAVARDGNGTPNGSMGVDATDYDGSGRASLWVANYENELHALYRNVLINDRMAFSYSTSQAGLAVLGPRFVGFGTLFVDANRDGWEDIVVNNGHVMQHHPKDFVKQPPVLFLNGVRDGKRYYTVNENGGDYFSTPHRGRGLSVADLDNRGHPDLVFCNTLDKAAIVRHDGFADHHWIGFELVGSGWADTTGARVEWTAGDVKRTRFVVRGRSYLSHSDDRLLIGLGETAGAGRLTVRWPSGKPRVEQFDGLAADNYHRVEQGKGKAE